MKKTRLLAALICLMAITACNKDDGPQNPEPDVIEKPDPEPENRAPGSFELLGPLENADRAPLKPSFSWEAAIDPDGDAILYDIYADTQNEPTTLLSSNIVETTFTPTENLALFGNYNWKVVAKDGKGGTSSSNTWAFVVRPKRYLVERANPENPGSFQGLITYDYDAQGRLSKITPYGTPLIYDVFTLPNGKIDKLVSPGDAYEYEYNQELEVDITETTSIEQRSTFVQFEEGKRPWLKIFYYENLSSGTITVYRTDFSYRGDEVLPYEAISTASVYDTSSEELIDEEKRFRFSFVWDENNNLTRSLEEKFEGEALKFVRSHEYVYDDRQNPLFDLVVDKMGFKLPFFPLLTPAERILPLTPGVGGLLWVSKNNVTSSIIRYLDNDNVVYEIHNQFDMEYNDEGYPIKVVKSRVQYGGSSTVTDPDMEFTYRYLEDE